MTLLIKKKKKHYQIKFIFKKNFIPNNNVVLAECRRKFGHMPYFSIVIYSPHLSLLYVKDDFYHALINHKCI